MKLNRDNRLIIGLCTTAAILIAKLFSIQIIDDKYKTDAANNHADCGTCTYPFDFHSEHVARL